MKFPLLFLLIMIWSSTLAEDDFIDPFDMVNFDQSTKTMKKKDMVDTSHEDKNIEKGATMDKRAKDVVQSPPTTPPTVSSTQVPPVVNTKQQTCKTPEKSMGVVLFRKFVKGFLSFFKQKAPETTQEYHVWIKLSKDQYTILQKFADGQSNVHDAQEILGTMITDVTRSNVGTTAKFSMWFEDKTGASLDAVFKIVAIMVLISFVLYMEIHVHVSWRRRVTQLVVLAFLISIPMTWYELYQSAQISQQTVTMKEAPKECVKDMDEGNMFSVYVSTFKRLFTLEKDNCQQYYEQMLIDPFLKVTPTKAIAVTFVRFFLAPLKDVGSGFSEFMRALLIDLPVTLYPVAIVIVAMCFFMFLFMWFGYSIRLPFFLSIEPTPRVTIGASTDNTQALEDVKKQLEALQGSIQTSETNMAEQFQRFASAQTAAIEYTVSTMSNNVAPPTFQPAITINRSDHSFESSDEIDVKSPIPCSDDSFSVVDDNGEDFIRQETHSKVVPESLTQIFQESTRPIDNIGPNS